jgi:DNA/RNA non-specific endonuclease
MMWYRNFLTIIGLLIINLLSAQSCNFDNFVNDLSKNDKDFTSLMNNSQGFQAWQILEAEASTLRTNIEELQLVSKNLDAIKTAGNYKAWKAGQGVSKVGKAFEDIVDGMKADCPKSWKFNKIRDDAFEIVDGSGRKWGTVTKDKIIAPARTEIGTAGNPIINRIDLLQKNMKYDVDGIIYQTDDLGRVIKINADLDDIARVRLGNQQIRAVDVKDGVRGVDQGGHIVGSRFFGPGEQINLYPQSANLNQGAWKTMENGWADAMVNGSDVKIEVEAIFSGASKRPDSFKVKYTIDGQPFQEKFTN